MVKIFGILLSILISVSLRGQILFEHDYDSASTFGYGSPAYSDQLMIVKFEVSGERYVKISRHGKKIFIYDLNHSLINTIDFSSFPFDINYPNMQDILYLSENLFDLDNGVEFMFIKNAIVSSSCWTGIYNDDGTLIFSDTGSALIRTNVPLQQYPIYNTSQGTKMILSYSNMHAKVFSLPGTLTTAIQIANQNLMQAQGLISNPVPNPTNNVTRVDYALPKGFSHGEISFFDQQGIEVKRFKVDNTFDHLLLSTEDIPAGTYYYQLYAGANTSSGRKLVVIK